jgi:exopolysaccharide/PEP-CTERM locus tyrosine autokinase
VPKVGKISSALEKYRQERKLENRTEAQPPAIKPEDWDVLMGYNKRTGTLNLHNRKVVKDPGTINRLLANRMISPDGRLSSTAKRQCEVRRNRMREGLAGEGRGNRAEESIAEAEEKQIDSQIDTSEIEENTSEHDQLEDSIITSETPEIPERSTESPLEEAPKISAPPEDTIENRVITEVGPTPENKVVKRTHTFSESKAIDNNLVTLLDPLSYEAEQFKILRTSIFYPVSGKVPRSILVTSTMPGEGKSFVASNLAIAISQDIDRYVLLVDCDLRQPSINSLFGFGDVPGLSDYLIKDTDLQDLLINTRVQKLSILPAGKTPPNPAELLSSEKMAALLGEITKRYQDRMIIIDSPPPKLTAESSFLARKVDGIILAVNYGKTRRDDVKDLVKKLGKDKILGSVMNRFDRRSLGYYGYMKDSKYGHYYNIKS